MKNKTVAGVLALVAGYMGLHRFYLGQVGLGIAYIVLLPILLVSGLWFFLLIGLVDAFAFFSMDQDAFDDKYNADYEEGYDEPRQRKSNRQERPHHRRENRNERYAERPAPREPRRTVKPKAKKKKANPHLKAGKDHFKDYDYDEAISEFDKALKIDPQSIPAHFNLACAHSLMEHKDKAFYHLDRAVALGFDDFDTIKTKDHLAYLRIQPEFLQFEANKFRLVEQISAPKENMLDQKPAAAAPAASTGKPDLLEQLNQLAKLKEKGLLTEAEFQKQKEKLLG